MGVNVAAPRLARAVPRLGDGSLAAWRSAALIAAALGPGLALLALYAGFYAAFSLELLRYPFDLDQGEGYDAWSAWLMDRGVLPYSANHAYPYYSSNYPPLWSYLVSIPMAWLGPGLAAARLVSVIAALLATGVLAHAAWRRVASSGPVPVWAPALAATLAAGLFLGSPYVYHSTPLARVNGTTLLFAAVALSLFVAPGRWRLPLGVLALLAALLTKQTALDAAAACLLALALRSPRRAALAAGALGGLGLAALGLLIVATGGAFWTNVVAGNANPFDLTQLRVYLSNFGEVHAVVLVLGGLEAARALWRGDRSPWTVYLPLALAMSLTVGKWGAGESYFLGAIAAASVLAATLAARVVAAAAASPRSWRWLAPLGIALVAQGLLFSHGPLAESVTWLPDRGFQAAALGRLPSARDAAAAAELSHALRRAEGPVLVEDPSFAVAAGKPLVANATHLRNLHQAGLWDSTALVEDVRDRRYAMVVLHAQLYPEPVLEAIGDSYYLARRVTVNGATHLVFLPGSD